MLQCTNFFQYVNSDNSKQRDDPSCLSIPNTAFKHLGRSPYIMVCRVWNEVPYPIKIIAKHNEFRKALLEPLVYSNTEICVIMNCRACLCFNAQYNLSPSEILKWREYVDLGKRMLTSA